MKNYFTIIAVACIMAFSSCQQKEKQTNAQVDIVGVYQYLGDLEGMAVITPKHFLFTGRALSESSTVDSTEPYKNEFNSLIIEGGTWTMQDSIVTCNLLFGKEPSANGTFRFTYSFMGDTMVGNILNKKNQVIERISAKKLKQSNKQNDFIGVYQYLYPREGMSVLTEEYMIAAFRFIDEPLPSIDSKDYYKNLYNSLHMETGKYTLQDSIFSVYMLYAKNGFLSPEDEPSFRFSASFKGDSVVSRIINDKGEILGKPMYGLRLE